MECCFPLGVFGVLGSPSPSRGEGPGAPRIPNWEKLEYSYTIEIILYNFVIIFFKNLFKKINCWNKLFKLKRSLRTILSVKYVLNSLTIYWGLYFSLRMDWIWEKKFWFKFNFFFGLFLLQAFFLRIYYINLSAILMLQPFGHSL